MKRTSRRLPRVRSVKGMRARVENRSATMPVAKGEFAKYSYRRSGSRNVRKVTR